METLNGVAHAFPILILGMAITFIWLDFFAKLYTVRKGLPVKSLPEWTADLDEELDRGWEETVPNPAERDWLCLMKEIDLAFDRITKEEK